MLIHKNHSILHRPITQGGDQRIILKASTSTDDITADEAKRKLLSIGDATTCTSSCRSCMNNKLEYFVNSSTNISRKFFFLHIPKTGGLSVEMDLRKIVCGGLYLVKTDCFIGRNEKQYIALERGAFKYRTDPKQTTYSWQDFSVFSGHRRWGMIGEFVERERLVQATLLREPICRAVSHWNMGAGRNFGFDNTNNYSLHDALQFTINTFGYQSTVSYSKGAVTRNELVFWLCGVHCPDSMPLRSALERAKYNLLHTAVVGITENMNGFLSQLGAAVPWWPSTDIFPSFSTLNKKDDPENIRRRGLHKKINNVDELDAETLIIFKRLLWADIELYSFATELSNLKSIWAQQCHEAVSRPKPFSCFEGCY